jgi:hypothetical protein
MSLAVQWPIRITVSLPRTSGPRSDQLGRGFRENPGAEQTEIGRRVGGGPPATLGQAKSTGNAIDNPLREKGLRRFNRPVVSQAPLAGSGLATDIRTTSKFTMNRKLSL